jgi:hypothetical protein
MSAVMVKASPALTLVVLVEAPERPPTLQLTHVLDY